MRNPAVVSSLVAVAFASAGAGCGSGLAFPDGSSWAQTPRPAFASQARLAITDNGDDTLAFVSMDLPKPRLDGFIPIGDIPVEREGPHHIAAARDGKSLFVGLSNYVPGSGAGPHGSHGLGTVPGSLLKLDAATGEKIGEAVVDRSPGDVILTRDGNTAYVSHYDLLRLQDQQDKGLPVEQGFSTIAVIDTRTMARPNLFPICATAHGIVLSDDEKTLYAACGQTDELAIMDLATHTATRVPVGAAPGKPLQPNYFPYALARAPKDGSIWISCERSGEVRVFDPRTQKIDESRTITVGGVPLFGSFLSDGKTLVVPHQGDEALSVIETSTSKETGVIHFPNDACLNAHVAMVMPDDETVYVVCEGDHATMPGTVLAASLRIKGVLDYVKVGLFPDGIVALPPAP